MITVKISRRKPINGATIGMSRITLKQMSKLFHRLAVGYKAGLDIRRLYQKETELGSPKYRLRSKQIADDIGRGEALSKAMENADDFFPQLSIAVVQAGEQGDV